MQKKVFQMRQFMGITVIALLCCADICHAGATVYFKGKLTSIQASGTVDAISQYLSVGDTFEGSFAYNTGLSGSSFSTINNVGSAKQFSGPYTSFSLTMKTGNSAGYSIQSQTGLSTSLSSMSIWNDVLNSSNDNFVTDITSGVVWSDSDVFRAGLRNRNFVFRFWDFVDAAMLSSSAISDWNADSVFQNRDIQNNELAFNSTVTNFAQIAKFEFTEFTSIAPAAAVPEPGSILVWSVTALGVIAARRRAKNGIVRDRC